MEPVRTCVGCRQRANPNDLLRVIELNGSVEPDPKANKPGRGAWLHTNSACLKLAVERKAFGRAFRFAGQIQVTALTKYVEQAETMLATK
jgi:uncharacterized protein